MPSTAQALSRSATGHYRERLTVPVAELVDTLYVAPGVILLGFAAAYLRYQGLFRLHTARFRTERQRERLSEAIADISGSTSKGNVNSSKQEDGVDLILQR
jgi:hypothetical protein